MNVKLTFTEELLGTASANADLYSDFIASKNPNGIAPDELESLSVDEEIQESTTIFHRDAEGTPIIYDYQLKGFFKDACGCLRRVTGTRSNKLKAYKKEIDGLIFPEPRQIKIEVAGEIKICERPLRASTAQGERIALARSEAIPAGSTILFNIVCLKESLEKEIEEWLDYGKLRGLGQWRNSGKGRFTVEYPEAE